MFKLIPTWVLLAAYGLLLAALGLQTLHVYQLKAQIDKTAIATLSAVTAGLQLKIDTDKETRLKNEEADRNYQVELDRLRGDLALVPPERLSNSPALTTIVVQARKACPTAPGAPVVSGDPIGVLADVLGRSDRVAEVYAKTADERRIAGLRCEGGYNALPE